jgi:zinc ribbon protein
MYCPNCGSSNKSGVKFCARCGMSLAAITDAMAGKPGATALIDERAAKLIKEYYKGRREAITGGVLIPAWLAVMGIILLAGPPPVAAFFITCWMFFWGASALATGLGKCLAASGEMKALGISLPGKAIQNQVSGPHQVSGPQKQLVGGAGSPNYSTGPMGAPASVTENTTRQLDAAAYMPPDESRSKQSQ